MSSPPLLPSSKSMSDFFCACSHRYSSKTYKNSLEHFKSTSNINDSLFFSIPQSLKRMGAPAQAIIVLIYYALHVVVFPYYEYVLDPMNDLIFSAFNIDTEFCLDDIVGLMTLLCTWIYHRVNNLAIPRLFNVSEKSAPWGEVTLSPYQGLCVVLSIFGPLLVGHPLPCFSHLLQSFGPRATPDYTHPA